MNKNHAEKLNYFRTSKTGSEKWMERIEQEIENAGGVVLSDAYGRDSASNQAAFMVEFRIGQNTYRAVWPVADTCAYKNSKEKRSADKAAKVQAITALFHDIKNSCVKAKFVGDKKAFFDYLVLPDGRTASQASIPELMDNVPSMLSTPRLNPPENIIDIQLIED